MKSLAAAESAAITHFLQFRIQWASIALLYYDYALTFPAEVKYIWGKKFRFSTALYICCRYALIANVLYLAAIGVRLETSKLIQYVLRDASCSCDTWYKFDGVISVLGRVAVVATLTGRTYAVYGCNRIVLVLLGSLGLTCIILDIMHVPGLNCIGGTTDRIMFICCSEAGLLAILMCVFEFLAAILTIARCIQERRLGGSWKWDGASFLAMISKQGITYYCIISIFTTAAVVLSFRAPTGSFFQRLPNAFNLPVSCLLTARFLLQLREWQSMDHVSADATANGAETRQAQTLSTLQAVAVVDAALLDDFGDYILSAQSSWETESTGAYDFTAETGKNGEIAMDSLGSTGQNMSIKELA
ncbi:hypothetical protein ACEPAG_9388 [Sanghuangporus baumii]